MKPFVRRAPAVQAAIDAAGGLRALARLLSISPSSINDWGKVPAKRVLEIERRLGVSRHVLNPEIYPEERS